MFLHALSGAVLLDTAIDVLVNEVFEVVAALQDVIHAAFSQKLVKFFLAVNLESDRSEQAISIAILLFDLHLTLLHEFVPKLLLFARPILTELLKCLFALRFIAHRALPDRHLLLSFAVRLSYRRGINSLLATSLCGILLLLFDLGNQSLQVGLLIGELLLESLILASPAMSA